MNLLVLVLNREEYLDDVLLALTELGVQGATLVDSVGIRSVLVKEIPIFAGLRYMPESPRPINKTIFAVIKDDAVAEKAVEVIQDICNLSQPGTGIVFLLPVDRVEGLVSET